MIAEDARKEEEAEAREEAAKAAVEPNPVLEHTKKMEIAHEQEKKAAIAAE